MKKIIMDVDPGLDDISAMIMLFNNSDKIKINLISVVGGNVDIKYALKNTLMLVQEFSPYDIPVVKGVNAPLDNSKRLNAGDVHGKTGIGNALEIKNIQKQPLDVDFLDALRDQILKTKNVTLVTIGPLTNIALLFKKYPEVKKHIKEIVSMGGAIYGEGNYTKFAEYNYLWDADAAKYVVRSGVKFIMSPIESGHRTIVTNREIQSRCKSTKAGRLISQIFSEIKDPNIRFGFAFHDSCAAAYLLKPSLFRKMRCDIKVVSNKLLQNHAQCFCNLNKKGKHTVVYPKNTEKLKNFILSNMFKEKK